MKILTATITILLTMVSCSKNSMTEEEFANFKRVNDIALGKGANSDKLKKSRSRKKECRKFKDGSCDTYEKLRDERCEAWAYNEVVRGGECREDPYAKPYDDETIKELASMIKGMCKVSTYEVGIPTESCIEDVKSLNCNTFNKKKGEGEPMCGGDSSLLSNGRDPDVAYIPKKITKVEKVEEPEEEKCTNYQSRKGCDPHDSIRRERCSAWAKTSASKHASCNPESDSKDSFFGSMKENFEMLCLRGSHEGGSPSDECIAGVEKKSCEGIYKEMTPETMFCGGDSSIDKEGGKDPKRWRNPLTKK